MLLEIFRFLHLVGLAFGLGGATIAAVISRKAEKDKELGKVVMKLMPSISKVIWLGLILLIISGGGLSIYVKWPIDKNILLLKHVLVAWLFVIGIFIGSRVKKIAKLEEKGKPSAEFLRIMKQIKIFSIINLILWYLTTILAVFV